MKYVGLFSICFLLWGCVGAPQDAQRFQPILPVSKVQKPSHFWVESAEDNRVGIGTPLTDEIAVVTDHLLRDKEVLYWREKPLEVVLRDFDVNTLYVNLGFWEGAIPDFADTPPAVGQKVYWLNEEDETTSGKVLSVLGDGNAGASVTLSGVVDHKSLGSPVFNEEGKVYGILTGADRSKTELYMTRTERLRNYLGENR